LAFAPSGTIYLIANVKADHTYNTVRDFSSASSQLTYFQGKAVYTLTEYTYIRKDSSIRVEKFIENLYGVNYILYRNGSGKWIYSFITDKKYINDFNTELFIETDVMQTYMFDYDLLPSFVEREHIASDTIGANIVPEGLELGEYVVNHYERTELFDNLWVMIGTPYDKEGTRYGGGMFAGVYSGVGYHVFDVSGGITELVQLLFSHLDELGKGDSVTTVSMIPHSILGPVTTGSYIMSKSTPEEWGYIKNKISSIDGYVPKNKKLFTSPYCMLMVTNFSGSFAKYQYEMFSGSQCEFKIVGTVGADCSIALIPKSYKGDSVNYNEMLTLKNFPQCNFTTDTFKNWFAQNQSSIGIGLSTGLVSTASAVATKNPIAGASGLIAVASSIGQMFDRQVVPDQVRGNANGGSLNIALNIQDFGFYDMSITANMAKVIDDYFTMYGYKTNRVKIPNTRTRTNFNYVKTIGCNLTGNMDIKDLDKIKSVYDNGVTLWHTDTYSYSTENIEVIS
jgi:hypothetical protein